MENGTQRSHGPALVCQELMRDFKKPVSAFTIDHIRPREGLQSEHLTLAHACPCAFKTLLARAVSGLELSLTSSGPGSPDHWAGNYNLRHQIHFPMPNISGKSIRHAMRVMLGAFMFRYVEFAEDQHAYEIAGDALQKKLRHFARRPQDQK